MTAVRDDIEEVLLLQTEFASANTPSMRRRGELVRNVIADQVRDLLPGLAAEAAVHDLRVQGRDGTGLKTEIPWLRVYSESRSERPTAGWYVVFLFAAAGDRVCLSLNQGTTQWTGVDFRPRPEHELKARVAWARTVLASEEPDYPAGWSEDIALDAARTPLGRQYEIGNVIAAEYGIDAVPSDEQIEDDLRRALRWLGALYRAETAGIPVPGEVPPEVLDAEQAIERAAGRPGKRAGFRLSVADKKAIEEYAVAVATAHLEGLGYAVKDVGAKESYDLDATRNGERVKVEVKGTTSLGQEVVLTRNEVLLHQKECPNTALAVVHSILLDRSVSPPSASGGTLVHTQPWAPLDEDLVAMSYRYATGL